MKLQIKKIVTINDIGTWFKYAEPEGGESQWKEGRSAMEFARYMTSSKEKMPDEIQHYLDGIGFKEEYTCYPEEVTSFDKKYGTGSGRHHDGLLVSEQYLVGIEAKVSEAFDKPIKIKIKNALSNADEGANMKTRIVESLKTIKPDFKEQDLDSVGHLMYQLVSGTVGTIIEAQNRNKTRAAFLIIEFAGDVYKEKDYGKNVNNNQKAYDAFLAFLGLSDKTDKERYIQLDNLKIWINKIKINICKGTYTYSEKSNKN